MRSRPEIHRVPFVSLGFILFFLSVADAPSQAPSPLPSDGPLRLADCWAISEERQPSLLVARARLAAAQSRLASLESLAGPVTRLRHDLPLRQQQARLGIDAAQAELARLSSENRYV